MDSRTLLNTPRELEKIDVDPGHYIHIGVESNLRRLLSQNDADFIETIMLDVHIDGVPIFSDNIEHSFWIISGRICNYEIHNIFVIGLYHGKSKPKIFNDFLKPFVDEINKLKNKISFNIVVKIRSIICDAIARASACGTKQYNAYNGCPKCMIQGISDKTHHKMCFPHLNNIPRTDSNFAEKQIQHFISQTQCLKSLK